MDEEKDKKKTSFSLFGLYVKIRQWVQPFWKPIPKKAKKKKEKSISTHGDELGLHLRKVKMPLTEAYKWDKQPEVGECWTFHNGQYHQLYACLAPQSGFAFKERSNEARRQTKLHIGPKDNKRGRVHRTHMLPIGYHGSENDERLVIGWLGNDNVGPFNEFEQRMKKLPVEILWLTSIEHFSWGAKWTYKVFDAKSKQLIDSLEATMKEDFNWGDIE